MPRAIAVAQTVPARGDVAANIRQHRDLARLAAGAGARVVVFPELSLTGYELELAEALAFGPADGRLAPLVEVAAAESLTVIAGAPVRLAGRLHIGAFIVLPTGDVDVYTKQHLGAFPASASCDGVVPPPERTFFEPGTSDPLVRFDGHTAAVAVCADTSRPSHPERAAARGADSYLACTFVIPSEYDADSRKFAATAARLGMAVAFANYGAATGGLASAGRSAIWSPTGVQLVQLETAGAGIAVATEGADGWQVATHMLRAG